jgi:hypothetical protein
MWDFKVARDIEFRRPAVKCKFSNISRARCTLKLKTYLDVVLNFESPGFKNITLSLSKENNNQSPLSEFHVQEEFSYDVECCFTYLI